MTANSFPCTLWQADELTSMEEGKAKLFRPKNTVFPAPLLFKKSYTKTVSRVEYRLRGANCLQWKGNEQTLPSVSGVTWVKSQCL